MTVNLSSQITRYGVSSSFNALFESLRETPGIYEKKYRSEDVNKVAQYLVCRNYGKACLELSYLAWAVVNYPAESMANAPLLEFFWLNESITPARFRAAFAQPYQASENNYQIAINEAGLQLGFFGQSTSHFVISPTRVGVLAVLLEFITTVDPQQLQVIEQSIKDERSEQSIKSLSSNLQKIIYQYLSEHLIQAQQQRRFRYVTQWLDRQKSAKKSSDKQGLDNQQLGQTSSSSNVTDNFLTDETLLSFWQQAAVDENSPGFKLYSSALHDFIDVHTALQQAKDSLEIENSTTIGFDLDSGEYSPDLIQTILFDGEHSDETGLAWLSASPKFLTKTQWAFIEPLMLHNAQLKPLALSLLRLTIFGHWQAAIVQAKRKSQQNVIDKLAQTPIFHYQKYQQQLAELDNVINHVQLAVIHIFYHLQDSRYLGLALPFLSAEEQLKIQKLVNSVLDDTGKEDSAFGSVDDNQALDEINTKLFLKSKSYLLQSLPLQQVMQKAKAAFNANNKAGFQQIPDAENSDIYQDGHDAMVKCQQAINTLDRKLMKLWSQSSSSETNFSSDVSIFKSMFSQLYL
jgi:hypothetical protein